MDKGSQHGRFALAVVADDRRPLAVLDFELDFFGDDVTGVTDRQVFATDGGALAGLDSRRADSHRWFIDLDLDGLQLFELLGFASRLTRRRRVGAIFFDKR